MESINKQYKGTYKTEEFSFFSTHTHKYTHTLLKAFFWLTDFADVLDSLADDLAEGELLADAEGTPWTEKRLIETMAAYTAEHHRFRMDVEGRSLTHTIVTYDGNIMQIQQMLQDEEGFNDWSIDFTVNLDESRESGMPLIKLARIGEV